MSVSSSTIQIKNVMIQFKLAKSHQNFEDGETLFKAYLKELGIDLAFQDFEKELENIRLAARLLEGELEDPDIDKKIVVEGNGQVLIGDQD